jgi:hypothetical protein
MQREFQTLSFCNLLKKAAGMKDALSENQESTLNK